MFFNRIPIIVDTDIGGDIDDAWAVALLLRSPEFDIKLIATAVGDTTARAKITAKMLEAAGRTDIPIAIGLREVDMDCYCRAWADDYDLDAYPGTVYDGADAIRAIVDTINDGADQTTVLSLAPLSNIAAALDMDAGIVERSRLVGMLGSIYRGYDGIDTPSKECNIVKNIAAAKKVFAAGWDMTITPLDTCGLVKLRGDKYKAVKESEHPLMKALIENYDAWLRRPGFPAHPYASVSDIKTHSSTLFDTVAVYLAMAEDLFEMRSLPIGISDDGYTVVSPGAADVRCALQWRDITLFEDFLVERLADSGCYEDTNLELTARKKVFAGVE